jgi:gliding motility-associated-like protein
VQFYEGMKRCVYILFILLFCCCISVKAQHTTQGKDFWVSFGTNANEAYTTLTFQIRIVTMKATKVTFTFTTIGSSSSVLLEAGGVYTRNLSHLEKSLVYSNTTDKSSKSLHIESDEDISVYSINLTESSTDATAVLPVNSLGLSYYHISYNPVTDAMDGYTLIATEDGTSIYENGTYRIGLNKGEVYSHYFGSDATGRHVSANKPIAYFTTNSCVYVPNNVSACDCLYEQLFPETAWGVSFMVPVTILGKERVRVVASKNGTKITHLGGIVVYGSLNLNAGQYLEIEITKDNDNKNGISYDGCYIEANNPVAVVSYLTGSKYGNPISGDKPRGDPAMTWIPSIQQSMNELLLAPFVTSGSSLLTEHHVLIVTPTADKALTEMSIGNNNYMPLSNGEWTDHISGYSFYSMPLTIADKGYRFRNPGGITILGYGLGFYESYYYSSGSATRKLNAAFYINDIHHQDLNGKEFCSDKFDIKAVVKYEMHPEQGHLRWFIDGTEDIAARDLVQWKRTFSENNHTISMIVKDKKGDMDTLTISLDVKIQKIDVGDTAICKGQRLELKVNNPSDQLSYRWYADAAFSDFIQQGMFVTPPLNSDTVFYIEATSSIGCRIRDSLRVNLHPVVDLLVEDIVACNNVVVRLQAFSANAVSLKWYSDANFSDFIVQADLFETVGLEKDTVFYVEALSANGCTKRDSVKVAVYNVATEDVTVCYDATATISIPATDVESLAWYRNPDYTGFIAGTVSFETAKLKTDTVFYIEILSTKGCVAKNSVKVTINHSLKLSVSDTSVCGETTIRLFPVTNAVLLNWYNDAAYSNLINQTVAFTTTVHSDTVFYVEAFSNESCSMRDSIMVSVFHPPSVKAMDDLFLCYGEEIILDVVHSDGYLSWNVNPATFKAESTQEYIVTASRPPCPDARDSVVITVGDSLWIAPSVLPVYRPFDNYSLQLNTNGESPNYTKINGELPLGLFLSLSGEISGVPNSDNLSSVFTVQIEDEHNCTFVQEYVLEKYFHIPKIFTPNGDGINDIFMYGHEISVFDRFGTIIFKGDNGWDGTYKNKPVPQTVYFYTLKRKLANGEIEIHNGYVGIIY